MDAQLSCTALPLCMCPPKALNHLPAGLHSPSTPVTVACGFNRCAGAQAGREWHLAGARSAQVGKRMADAHCTAAGTRLGAVCTLYGRYTCALCATCLASHVQGRPGQLHVYKWNDRQAQGGTLADPTAEAAAEGTSRGWSDVVVAVADRQCMFSQEGPRCSLGRTGAPGREPFGHQSAATPTKPSSVPA